MEILKAIQRFSHRRDNDILLWERAILEYTSKNCQKLKYNCWNFKNAVKCLNNSKNTEFQMSEQEDRVEKNSSELSAKRWQV